MNLIFKKARILVVEDEKIIAKDIESTLKRIGHESAGTVSKGEDAIRIAGETRPDLILMDITLKGEIDGIEAARIVNETLKIPVVYITAHQDEDTIEKTKNTNPFGYITKPLDDRDLNTAINSAMYRYDVESRLKAAEEKYFRLSENAADMIFSQEVTNLVYKYVNASSFRITGYTPEEYYEKPGLLDSLVHPDWKEQYQFSKQLVLKSNIVVPFEFMIIHKTGKEVWLNQRSVIVKNDQNNIDTIEAIITDVTERKKYEDQLEETTKKLRALSNYQQRVREEERLYIAREIHDQLGQDLTVLKMDLSMLSKNSAKYGKEKKIVEMDQVCKELKEMNNTIDGIINKVRKIATELRPDILDKLGIAEAIEWHSAEFEKRSNIKCITKTCENDIELNPEKAISIFRIFQETLTNAARHSGATELLIEMDVNNGWLILRIKDNGKGITESEIENGSSLGILGMRERALLLGGFWTIKGEPGKGTEVEVKVPLN
jgi:two-component system sensor histidine kinase UhpB